MHINNSVIVKILLIVILFWGLLLRLYGVIDNHSFWSDEALSASFARDIVLNQTQIIKGATTISYQPLHVLTMALFMKILGTSEFSARLPYVIFGAVGIILAYLLAEKLSGRAGGLLAAFLIAFSQLNLANSTQAKPTAATQTLVLLMCYLLIRLQDSTSDKKIIFHFFIILTLIGSALYHFLGGIAVILYFSYLLFSQKNVRTGFFLLMIAFLGFIIYLNAGVSTGIFNNTMYLKNLLLKQYGIFLIPMLLSMFFLFKKRKTFVISVLTYSFAILFWWNFQSYSHNLRYIAPYMALLFVFAGTGFAQLGNLILKRKSWIVLLAVFIFFFISGYKLVLRPQAYYNPNLDFYGDVQIADYKTFYTKLKAKYSDLNSVVVFNDVLDAQRWYLNKEPDTYFSKGIKKPLTHRLTGKKIYGSLKDFLVLKEKNKKGFLIVEDWESILPEDIKQYAKKNLKLQLRVESLPNAKNDPWPLELYSW